LPKGLKLDRKNLSWATEPQNITSQFMGHVPNKLVSTKSSMVFSSAYQGTRQESDAQKTRKLAKKNEMTISNK
jgi:hypothetical protein